MREGVVFVGDGREGEGCGRGEALLLLLRLLNQYTAEGARNTVVLFLSDL